MTKRAVWVVAMVVIVLSAGSVVYRLIVPDRTPFASVQWMTAASDQDYARRYTMLQDLRGMLDGGAVQDRESAQLLLGTPERRAPENDLWGYRLGVDDQWSRRYERWLELLFDGDGRYAGYRVLTESAEAPSPERAVME